MALSLGTNSLTNYCVLCVVSELQEDSNPSQQERRLQALAAVSTHPSIVRETVPVLLQHFQQIQQGSVRIVCDKLLILRKRGT